MNDQLSNPQESTPSATAVSRGTAGVLMPPPLLYLGSILIGIGLEAQWPARWIPSSIGPWVGIVLCVLGAGLFVWAVGSLRAAHTAIATSRASSCVVVTGPYRMTRNPMYLAFTMIHIGLAALTGSAWLLVTALVAFLVVNVGVILREERYLESRFGEAYVKYKQRVDRWL
ncbi:MAG: isoprenylcysteine carboxylmethyltransferase family protein [Phycisphaeraceae bacterium]|nr:isoprenylcysteine carboxylmethyltransferase family protein [Phycisphaeraceae bacterium]MCW5754284.1 isoprenylcysteine carboxylmethyltransferase family protein [Phycisphaeraceae bacterium]